MAIGRSLGERVFDAVNTALMLLSMFLCTYPLLYVAFASVSEPARIVAHRGLLLHPLGFKLESYKRVFENPMISVGYLNTLFLLVVGTSINLALTTLGAYVLSRTKFKLRHVVMFGIVFTMMFKGGLIPFYLQVRDLGLLDTVWSMILPSAISAWNLIIMRTYFLGIPDSMEESAYVDGANDWVVLLRIILPLATPVVAVMVLFYGVQRWNAWFHAMIFLRERNLYPLQIILREILIANSTNSMTGGINDSEDAAQIGETIKYATIIVATLPILLIYPLLQKYFVKGVMIGAIKG